MPQTATQITTELNVWYAARVAAADGQSITIATSAGSRTLSSQNLTEINSVINLLERQLAEANSVNKKVHNFAVANFNHESNP